MLLLYAVISLLRFSIWQTYYFKQPSLRDRYKDIFIYYLLVPFGLLYLLLVGILTKQIQYLPFDFES